MRMLLLLAGAGAIACARWWMKRTEQETRDGVDRWVAETLATALAKDLGRDADDVARTLREEPEPAIVEELERAVRDVRVVFRRRAEAGAVDVSVEFRTADGRRRTLTGTHSWDDMPSPVREEMVRTGKRELERPWDFPWAHRGET